MIVLTQQVYFPTSFYLGPADRFLAVLCVCSGLFGNRLVASLEKFGRLQKTMPAVRAEKSAKEIQLVQPAKQRK